MDFNFLLLMPIMLVVLGCVVSVSGEIHFSPAGLGLLLLSVACRGLKGVLQQKLMTGATKEKFDPVTLMAWNCLFSFVLMVVYTIATEGIKPVIVLIGAPNKTYLLPSLLGSCAIAC